MAGWGRCRRCGEAIWWGANPYDESRAFPYDDEDEEQSHFQTCAARERVADMDGEMHDVSRCRTCGARVWWQTTRRGARRPMDIDGDEATWTCHFDTCTPRQEERQQQRTRAERARQQEQEAREQQQRQEADAQRRRRYASANAPYEFRLWLPDLELVWPCTLVDIKTAFRRLALVYHPDVGGNAADFIRIKLAYDRLKQLLGEPAGVR